MNKTILTFDVASAGGVTVKPNSYPTTYKVSFVGPGKVYYGVDDAAPNRLLNPGPASHIKVDVGILNLRYELLGPSRLEWDH